MHVIKPSLVFTSFLIAAVTVGASVSALLSDRSMPQASSTVHLSAAVHSSSILHYRGSGRLEA